jgi:DNA-binding NtrC family response regulator
VRIHVPALRERPEDIPVLADFFLKKAAAKLDKPLQGFAPEVLRIFYEYGWKGNVRELENAVESAVAMSDGPVIVPADLPGTLQGASAGSGLPGLSHLKYDDAFVFFEKAYFEALISQCDGDIHAAAEKAQVSEKSVYRRKQRFGL